MRYQFVLETLIKLAENNLLDANGSILAICASRSEWEVFQEVGCSNVTISNLDDRMSNPDFAPYAWSYQDAQNLSFDAETFDYVFVSDGLHHCNSPHRGLLEMYRVARKGVIVFESRDSLLMRIASRMKLTAEYEIEAVIGNDCRHGGVDNTEIPNYVYRWTERELEKAISSYAPIGRHSFFYYYGLNLPLSRLAMSKSKVKFIAAKLAKPVVEFFGWLAPSQCNSFCMYVEKPKLPQDLWPWLKYDGNSVRFDDDFAKKW